MVMVMVLVMDVMAIGVHAAPFPTSSVVSTFAATRTNNCSATWPFCPAQAPSNQVFLCKILCAACNSNYGFN